MRVGVLRFAPGVKIKPHPAGARILGALDRAAAVAGMDLYVTSGAEDQGRKQTDPHMTGEAFDIRTRDLPPTSIIAVRDALRGLLDASEFTVLFEGPQAHPDARLAAFQFVNPHSTGFHFHIQRKKDTVFP